MSFGNNENKEIIRETYNIHELSDDEILSLIADEERKVSDRNAKLKALENVVYKGEFTDELTTMLGTEIRKSNRQKLMINLCQARVLDKSNQTRGIPDLKVKVAATDKDERYIRTRLTTNQIYSSWEFSNLPLLMPQIGFNLSMAGYQPVTCFPYVDLKKGIRKNLISIADPKSIIAGYSARSSIEFNWVAFSYKKTGREILNTYPGASKIRQIRYTDDEYEVKEWITDKVRKFYVIAGTGEDAYRGLIPDVGWEHDLGFIPVRVIQNVPTPNKLESISDIEHVIGLNENINEIHLLNARELRERLEPLLVIKGSDDLPEDIPDGAGKYITAGPEGDIAYVPKIAGNPAEVMNSIGSQMQTFREQTTWPLSISGTINSSLWTGKGINASQQGSRDLSMGVKMNIGAELIRLDEMNMAMEKKLWPDKKMEVYDYYGGPDGEKEFTYYYPEDLPDTNQVRHELVWYPQGYDASVEQVSLMQLVGQGIISKQTAREKLPNTNHDEEAKRIKRETEEEMQEQMALMNAQAQAQAAAAPPEQQAPPEEGTPFESPIADIPPEMLEAMQGAI